MKNLILLVCAAVLLIPFVSFSQNPNIHWYKAELKLNSGTKKGLVKIYEFGKKDKIKFKTDKDSKPEKIDQDDVKRIILTNDKGETAEYIYYYIHEKKKFKYLVQIVKEGQINLLARKLEFTIVPPTGVMPGGINIRDKFTPGWEIPVGDFNEYYVFKTDEDYALPICKIGSKGFQKNVDKYFSDCPKLVSKMKDGTFTRKNVPEMIDFYISDCQ